MPRLVACFRPTVLGKKAGLDPQKIYEVVRQYRQQRAVPIAVERLQTAGRLRWRLSVLPDATAAMRLARERK
jgi:hypothetical protein